MSARIHTVLTFRFLRLTLALGISITEKATLRKLDDDDSESGSQYKQHNEEDSISTASVPPVEQMGLFDGIFT